MKALWPIRIVSTANKREHWAVRGKRNARERGAACMLARTTLTAPATWPIVVTLTRVASTFIRDEHENLPMGFKAVVDGIADFLGIDDGDKSRVRWAYDQRKPSEGDRAGCVEVVSKKGRRTYYGVAIDVRADRLAIEEAALCREFDEALGS